MKKLIKRFRENYKDFKKGFIQEWNRQIDKGWIEVREFK